jgi:hypothetical protein
MYALVYKRSTTLHFSTADFFSRIRVGFFYIHTVKLNQVILAHKGKK